MNDYKNNWFYKMCSKQGGKNIVYIVVGVLLVLVGIMLFTAVISVLNFALMGFGLLMIFQGAKSMFSSMPKLAEQMQRMSADDLASLGNFPPQDHLYSTFYFTERYLCAPAAYALIRYDTIKDIHANTVRVSRGGQQSAFVNIEFNNGRPCIDINIKDYGTFLKDPAVFMALVQQHQAQMSQQGMF